MILFVFEGGEREPKIFKTLERLFFGGGDRIVCSFGNNIYELYRQLEEFEGDGDLVSILRENGAHLPYGRKSSDFSEIYLFFDHDFQNTNLTLEEMNGRMREMLELFDDETDNGKLYVSYPMVESLCYTKQLPDYGHHRPGKKEIARVRQNWKWLVFQHTSKANYICSGDNKMPAIKDIVGQSSIFKAQSEKYLSNGERISVLNGFPLFLYEYFKKSFWQ